MGVCLRADGRNERVLQRALTEFEVAVEWFSDSLRQYHAGTSPAMLHNAQAEQRYLDAVRAAHAAYHAGLASEKTPAPVSDDRIFIDEDDFGWRSRVAPLRAASS